MADQVVYFRGSRDDVRRLLARFARAWSGAEADPWNVVQGLQLRLGVRLLGLIQGNFLALSRGGVGVDGTRWPALKRETVAQRRTSATERKALGIGGKRTRGLLTPAQDKRWRQLFARNKAMLQAKFGLGEREAARAAQIAWATLKKEGARTKLDVLGGRQVDMLRDTNVGFQALSPGVEDRPSGADGQVFETPPGAVVVGVNKRHMVAHHYGVPGKLPRRRLWPEELPGEWQEQLLATLQRGMVRALVLVFERGRAA